MESTLIALGGILLRAVPTFILVLLLNFYLKRVFFKPMEKVLRERYDATEGARKLAHDSMELATAKAAEYAAGIRAARAEVYQAQEAVHAQLQEQLAAETAAARQRADSAVNQSKALLETDVANARVALARDAEALSNQIAQAVLRRSAA